MGTCKWTTEDTSYACHYSISDGATEDTDLLWVCRLRNNTPALFGSQSSLQEHSPWGVNFSEMFPKAFESYAHHLMGVTGPVALVNRVSMDHFGEILLTVPEEAIEVLEILRLPRNFAQAKKLDYGLNEKYAAAALAQYASL